MGNFKGNPETYEKLKRQADLFNKAEGTLQPYDCRVCRNKGYIQGIRYEEMYEDYIPVIVECKCNVVRDTLARAEASGLGDYLNKTIEDFEYTDAWQRDLAYKAIKFMDDGIRRNWFVVLGQSGSGKTLICSIVANHLLKNKGVHVSYITWTDFIGTLKRAMMSDEVKAASKYLEHVKTVEVLFVDELLKEYNSTDLKYIIEIINYRYTNNLKTIITSERTLNELLKIDEATFSRMVERADGYLTNIPKDIKKNYRLKGVL